MSVESILRKKGTGVATIAPDISVKRAADLLRAKNIGALVVTRENAILGLVSEREIVDAISRHSETATSMPVSEIMRHGVITVSPAETVSHAMNLMTRHRVRRPHRRQAGPRVRHIAREGRIKLSPSSEKPRSSGW